MDLVWCVRGVDERAQPQWTLAPMDHGAFHVKVRPLQRPATPVEALPQGGEIGGFVTRTRRSSDFWAPRQGRVWRAPSLRHCPGITHVIVRKVMAPRERWT